MFKILAKYKLDSKIPIIIGNYEVLHFDEMPILVTGTNYYGQAIIGSLAAEDEKSGIYRYFAAVVTDADHFKFVKRKISYKELLNSYERIFVIDKDINDNIKAVYEVPLNQIPIAYLPLPSAYCPERPSIIGTDFSVSLKGDLADKHEAHVAQVISISKHYEQFLTTIIDSADISKHFKPEIRQYANEAASFKINFRISFGYEDLFFNGGIIIEYVTNFIKYSLNKLPAETEQLLTSQTGGEDFGTMVEASLKRAYGEMSMPYTNEQGLKLRDAALKIPFELQKITDNLGEGFQYIQVSVSDVAAPNSKQDVIGVIDNEFSNEILLSTELILAKGDESEKDNTYKSYTIRIYDLNTKTRKGSAYLANSEDPKIIDSPHITIEGKDDLSNSKYTESLHLSKLISVSAKTTKSKGKFKYLMIKFES
jgi:hypothetical protein